MSSIAVSSVQHRFHHDRGKPQGAANDAPASPASSQPSIDTSGSNAAIAGLSALLGQITAAGSITAARTTETAATPADATPVVKPNLDALNRVLAHYAAQSTAKDTVIALVKD